jgi:O-antigen ligase
LRPAPRSLTSPDWLSSWEERQTGRRDLWSTVLSQPVSRMFGAGYESFWVGNRLATIQRLAHQFANQSHDGYIEILVNLGWVGIAFLALLIVTGYRKITRAVRRDPETTCLRLAYFVAALTYNFTEAAFKMMDPVWICFVWAIVSASTASRLGHSKLIAKPSITDGAVLSPVSAATGATYEDALAGI